MRSARVFAIACVVLVLLSDPAAARAPRATAWWHASNQGTVSVGSAPDVSDDQLLVEGVQPGTVAGDLPQQSAVAAVVFTLSVDEVVGRLRLRVDSASPGASVRACRVTTGFATTYDGEWSDVPFYDCDGAVDAMVDGELLDLGDVGHLREEAQLAVILLPSSPGRVVIHSPEDDALEVIDTTSAFERSGPSEEPPRKPQASVADTSSSGRMARRGPPMTNDRPLLGVSSEAASEVVQTDPFHAGPRRNDFMSTHDLGSRAAAAAVLLVLLAPFALWGTRRRALR